MPEIEEEALYISSISPFKKVKKYVRDAMVSLCKRFNIHHHRYNPNYFEKKDANALKFQDDK